MFVELLDGKRRRLPPRRGRRLRPGAADRAPRPRLRPALARNRVSSSRALQRAGARRLATAYTLAELSDSLVAVALALLVLDKTGLRVLDRRLLHRREGPARAGRACDHRGARPARHRPGRMALRRPGPRGRRHLPAHRARSGPPAGCAGRDLRSARTQPHAGADRAQAREGRLAPRWQRGGQHRLCRRRDDRRGGRRRARRAGRHPHRADRGSRRSVRGRTARDRDPWPRSRAGFRLAHRADEGPELRPLDPGRLGPDLARGGGARRVHARDPGGGAVRRALARRRRDRVRRAHRGLGRRHPRRRDSASPS